MRKWGGGAEPILGEEIGEGGDVPPLVNFFRRSIFFVAGVSVTHPVHLTRLLIPNIVWCGVNFLLFSATSFSLLEDPDKKWQIHFCTFVLSTMTRRLATWAGW